MRSSERFCLFVDEHRDTGRRDLIRNSPRFAIGGLLCRESQFALINASFQKLRLRLQKEEIHYSNLKTPHRDLVVSELSAAKFGFFASVSDKRNMIGHRNQFAASASLGGDSFYHWMVRLMLERATLFVGQYCAKNSVVFEGLDVYFDERGGMNYHDLSGYLTKLHMQGPRAFLNKAVIDFDVLDVKKIYPINSKNSDGVQLADFCTGALSRVFDAQKFSIKKDMRQLSFVCSRIPRKITDSHTKNKIGIDEKGIIMMPRNYMSRYSTEFNEEHRALINKLLRFVRVNDEDFDARSDRLT